MFVQVVSIRCTDLDELVEVALADPEDNQVGVGIWLCRMVAARIRKRTQHRT